MLTAICALVQPWEGIVIGVIGSVIANGSVALLEKLKIDDPVGKPVFRHKLILKLDDIV